MRSAAARRPEGRVHPALEAGVFQLALMEQNDRAREDAVRRGCPLRDRNVGKSAELFSYRRSRRVAYPSNNKTPVEDKGVHESRGVLCNGGCAAGPGTPP